MGLEPEAVDSVAVDIMENTDYSSLLEGLDGRVMVAYLNPGEVRHEFAQSLLGLMNHDITHDHHIGGIYGRLASGNLAVHRNEVVEHFLTTKHEWLLCFDADLEIAPDTADILLASALANELSVVCGLYVNVSSVGSIIPMIYLHNASTRYRTENIKAGVVAQWIEDGVDLVRADSTGAGCLLVHRSVLVTMLEKFGAPMPWFANDVAQDGDGRPVVQGEDHSFFLRLKELDIPVHVHLGVELTHMKVNGFHKRHLAQVAAQEAAQAEAASHPVAVAEGDSQ